MDAFPPDPPEPYVRQIPSLRQKQKQHPASIAAGADDAKYLSKYKDLKRKIKEIEAANDKMQYRIMMSKRNIQRMKLERAILYERLSGPQDVDVVDRHAQGQAVLAPHVPAHAPGPSGLLVPPPQAPPAPQPQPYANPHAHAHSSSQHQHHTQHHAHHGHAQSHHHEHQHHHDQQGSSHSRERERDKDREKERRRVPEYEHESSFSESPHPHQFQHQHDRHSQRMAHSGGIEAYDAPPPAASSSHAPHPQSHHHSHSHRHSLEGQSSRTGYGPASAPAPLPMLPPAPSSRSHSLQAQASPPLHSPPSERRHERRSRSNQQGELNVQYYQPPGAPQPQVQAQPSPYPGSEGGQGQSQSLPPVQHVFTQAPPPPLPVVRDRERGRADRIDRMEGIEGPPGRPLSARSQSASRIHNHQRVGPGTYINRDDRDRDAAGGEYYDRERYEQKRVWERPDAREAPPPRDWEPRERERHQGSPPYAPAPVSRARGAPPPGGSEFDAPYLPSPAGRIPAAAREERDYPASGSARLRSDTPASHSGSGSGLSRPDSPSRGPAGGANPATAPVPPPGGVSVFRVRPMNHPPPGAAVGDGGDRERHFVLEDGYRQSRSPSQSHARDRVGGGGAQTGSAGPSGPGGGAYTPGHGFDGRNLSLNATANARSTVDSQSQARKRHRSDSSATLEFEAAAPPVEEAEGAPGVQGPANASNSKYPIQDRGTKRYRESRGREFDYEAESLEDERMAVEQE